jgi:hypothetical protein
MIGKVVTLINVLFVFSLQISKPFYIGLLEILRLSSSVEQFSVADRQCCHELTNKYIIL